MDHSPTRPIGVVAEECLWLETRTRRELSIRLCQAGRPLEAATVEDPDGFITGAAVVLACSDPGAGDRTGVDRVHDPCVVLDFGAELTGYVELEVEGAAGTMIDTGFAERLVDGHFNNAIEGQFACRYLLRDGRQTWRSWAWRGFR